MRVNVILLLAGLALFMFSADVFGGQCESNCQRRRTHADRYICQKNASDTAKNATIGCNRDCLRGLKGKRAGVAMRRCYRNSILCMQKGRNNCDKLCANSKQRSQCSRACWKATERNVKRRCDATKRACFALAKKDCLAACVRVGTNRGKQELRRCHRRIDSDLRACLYRCK